MLVIYSKKNATVSLKGHFPTHKLFSGGKSCHVMKSQLLHSLLRPRPLPLHFARTSPCSAVSRWCPPEELRASSSEPVIAKPHEGEKERNPMHSERPEGFFLSMISMDISGRSYLGVTKDTGVHVVSNSTSWYKDCQWGIK